MHSCLFDRCGSRRFIIISEAFADAMMVTDGAGPVAISDCVSASGVYHNVDVHV